MLSYRGDNSGSTAVAAESFMADVMAIDQAYHCAVVFDTSETRLYVDGVLVYTGYKLHDNAGQRAAVRLGRRTTSSSYAAFCALDEVAVWAGAKYTAAFTPPTAPYAGNEANLRHLMHGDGTLAVLGSAA